MILLTIIAIIVAIYNFVKLGKERHETWSLRLELDFSRKANKQLTAQNIQLANDKGDYERRLIECNARLSKTLRHNDELNRQIKVHENEKAMDKSIKDTISKAYSSFAIPFKLNVNNTITVDVVDIDEWKLTQQCILRGTVVEISKIFNANAGDFQMGAKDTIKIVPNFVIGLPN